MKPGLAVEFLYGSGDTALGTVVSYNEETEEVVVRDEEGEIWQGIADWLTVLDEEAESSTATAWECGT
ncbi:hypothetical protein [Chromobacterium vaccinii]|uniref:hypothetical protein n=1 Tax=Chromobacterium vaccinii TaxID=1108595 RepID=UPI0034598068